uniref:Uncharacterized protein n=1 Tax=Lactuca sativa TaxID=4236 RepID=A0A9R1XUE2_LACSA|nr:hypothetical protein LSAT_V11C100001720 [Lactuca sativa]
MQATCSSSMHPHLFTASPVQLPYNTSNPTLFFTYFLFDVFLIQQKPPHLFLILTAPSDGGLFSDSFVVFAPSPSSISVADSKSDPLHCQSRSQSFNFYPDERLKTKKGLCQMEQINKHKSCYTNVKRKGFVKWNILTNRRVVINLDFTKPLNTMNTGVLAMPKKWNWNQGFKGTIWATSVTTSMACTSAKRTAFKPDVRHDACTRFNVVGKLSVWFKPIHIYSYIEWQLFLRQLETPLNIESINPNLKEALNGQDCYGSRGVKKSVMGTDVNGSSSSIFSGMRQELMSLPSAHQQD